jgi:hypothetical protein
MIWLIVAFFINLAIVVGFPAATIFYMGNVLLHLLLGTALLWLIVKAMSGRPALLVFGLLALISGIMLAYLGNITETRWLFWTHIVLSTIGLLLMMPGLFEVQATQRFTRRHSRARNHRARLECTLRKGLAEQE